MCGIAGYWQSNGLVVPQLAISMAQRLVNRGPDDDGVWIDVQAGIALAHRRLSILDLSPAGHQPMHSGSGRYVIVFNGEIYNHADLRAQLDGCNASLAWHGHSDTEVLLAAIEAWGLDYALRRCVGMFALALWDRRECALFLARDRLGEKPLYYGWQGPGEQRVFLFGSELKALRAHPAFQSVVDPAALAEFMRYGYVPTPRSIYRGIHKLPPGTWLRVSPDSGPVPYWSLSNVIERGRQSPFIGTKTEAITALRHTLGAAIAGQKLADVALGAFLSGGIDSSTVVALMQAQSAQPVRTFTIGFGEARYDEADQARAVAHHLGTEHTEWRVTPEDACAVIPRLPELYDEPFADSSQIPTLILCQLTRSRVTVALSGDGGDELFGGYNRYLWTRRQRRFPYPLRSLASTAFGSLAPARWDRLYEALHPLLPGGLKVRMPGDKAHKLAGVLTEREAIGLYRYLVSTWDDPAGLVIGATEDGAAALAQNWAALADLDSDEHRMMALDTLTYLSDDILCKVDRAAMGVSLETRVPMLDHRVVEFAWSLPLSLKVRDGQGKWLLRQVLDRYVPRALIDRPKMGFAVPIDDWLRGPLRAWAEDLLAESRLRQDGYLRPGPVRRVWEEHLSGRRNWQAKIWTVLMFQAWLAEYKPAA